MIYLKLDGSTIISHSLTHREGYNIEIPYTKIINREGDYIYKYTDQLELMSQSEIDLHPNKIDRLLERQIGQDTKINRRNRRTASKEFLKNLDRTDLATVAKLRRLVLHLVDLLDD